MSSFLNIADVPVGVRQTDLSNLSRMSHFWRHTNTFSKRDGYLASHLALSARSPHVFSLIFAFTLMETKLFLLGLLSRFEEAEEKP